MILVRFARVLLAECIFLFLERAFLLSTILHLIHIEQLTNLFRWQMMILLLLVKNITSFPEEYFLFFVYYFVFTKRLHLIDWNIISKLVKFTFAWQLYISVSLQVFDKDNFKMLMFLFVYAGGHVANLLLFLFSYLKYWFL